MMGGNSPWSSPSVTLDNKHKALLKLLSSMGLNYQGQEVCLKIQDAEGRTQSAWQVENGVLPTVVAHAVYHQLQTDAILIVNLCYSH